MLWWCIISLTFWDWVEEILLCKANYSEYIVPVMDMGYHFGQLLPVVQWLWIPLKIIFALTYSFCLKNGVMMILKHQFFKTLMFPCLNSQNTGIVQSHNNTSNSLHRPVGRITSGPCWAVITSRTRWTSCSFTWGTSDVTICTSWAGYLLQTIRTIETQWT